MACHTTSFDLWDVTEPASVVEYQRAARAAIDSVLARGRPPLLVGGSGLYVRAALEEFDFPGTEPEVRSRLEAELAVGGPGSAASAARLARPGRRGPDPAEQRPPHRAGTRRSSRSRAVRSGPNCPSRARTIDSVYIGVDLDTAALDERIQRRVDQMWAAGPGGRGTPARAAQGLRRGRTASRALGYQQVLRFLAGECTEDDARTQTVQATRRFVRRQRSWFRRDPRIVWLDAAAPDLRRRALALAAASADAR